LGNISARCSPIAFFILIFNYNGVNVITVKESIGTDGASGTYTNITAPVPFKGFFDYL
jgi:hypothetical protein